MATFRTICLETSGTESLETRDISSCKTELCKYDWDANEFDMWRLKTDGRK
jgi:hypothetical protein